MARRLILDTAVLVSAERGGTRLDDLLDDDDVAIAAITAAATGRMVVTSDASGFEQLPDVAMLDPTPRPARC